MRLCAVLMREGEPVEELRAAGGGEDYDDGDCDRTGGGFRGCFRSRGGGQDGGLVMCVSWWLIGGFDVDAGFEFDFGWDLGPGFGDRWWRWGL